MTFQAPVWLLALLSSASLALAALAVASVLTHDDVSRVGGVCAGASALLLAAVDRAQPRIGWQAARVLSDVALMSPVVPLIWP